MNTAKQRSLHEMSLERLFERAQWQFLFDMYDAAFASFFATIDNHMFAVYFFQTNTLHFTGHRLKEILFERTEENYDLLRKLSVKYFSVDMISATIFMDYPDKDK